MCTYLYTYVYNNNNVYDEAVGGRPLRLLRGPARRALSVHRSRVTAGRQDSSQGRDSRKTV